MQNKNLTFDNISYITNNKEFDELEKLKADQLSIFGYLNFAAPLIAFIPGYISQLLKRFTGIIF